MLIYMLEIWLLRIMGMNIIKVKRYKDSGKYWVRNELFFCFFVSKKVENLLMIFCFIIV